MEFVINIARTMLFYSFFSCLIKDKFAKKCLNIILFCFIILLSFNSSDSLVLKKFNYSDEKYIDSLEKCYSEFKSDYNIYFDNIKKEKLYEKNH